MKQFILMLCLPCMATAKVGDTVEQCDARYGTLGRTTKTARNYTKDGVETTCVFDNGRCSAVMYSLRMQSAVIYPALGEGPRFNESQTMALLKLNSGNSKWVQKSKAEYGEPFDGIYVTEDQTMHANVNSSAINVETVETSKVGVALIQPAAVSKAIESFKSE